MKTGKIANLIGDRGFGFIAQEDGEGEIFFHLSSLVDVEFDDLKVGDKVTFDVTEGPKGLSAVDVKKA